MFSTEVSETEFITKLKLTIKSSDEMFIIFFYKSILWAGCWAGPKSRGQARSAKGRVRTPTTRDRRECGVVFQYHSPYYYHGGWPMAHHSTRRGEWKPASGASGNFLGLKNGQFAVIVPGKK